MSKPDENEDTTVVGPIRGRAADREPRLAIGELFGPYRVISVLGRGGIGEVFEVEHEVLRKRFALKLLLASTDSPDTRKRFIREAQVMAALDHNHIVRVDDFGETSGKVWLRMELAEGVTGRNGRPVHTLAELVADRGPRLPERETRSALVQILDALECAHGAGVVHRDLKPGNILLDRSGRLKIADFGLVQVVGEHWMREQHDAARSNPGTLGSATTMVQGDQAETEKAVMGTWEFMSPEQKAGGEIDARSDLYATGLIAFRLLTGEHVLAMERPTELVRDLNREWDTWIRRAVATRPERRFANAAEMRAALPTLDRVMDTELTPDPELSQREVRNHKVEESLLQSETAPAHEPAQTDVDIPSHEAGFKGTWRNLAGWLRTPRGPIADTEFSPGSIPVRPIVAETPNALRALKRFEGLRTGRIRAALVNLFLPGLGHLLRGRPLVGGVFAAGGLAGADTRLWWGAGVVAMLVALFDSGTPSLSADDRKLGSRVRQFRVWYGIFTGLVIVVLVWGVLIVLAELGMVDLPRAFPRPDWTQSIITDLAVATGTLIVAFRLGTMLRAIVRLQRELSRGG